MPAVSCIGNGYGGKSDITIEGNLTLATSCAFAASLVRGDTASRHVWLEDIYSSAL